jgi:hypothetical protein
MQVPPIITVRATNASGTNLRRVKQHEQPTLWLADEDEKVCAACESQDAALIDAYVQRVSSDEEPDVEEMP